MIDDTDIKINIDYARNFAERSIKGNIKGVTPDDFMVEMRSILGNDLYNDLKKVIEGIRKINEEALVNVFHEISKTIK